LFSYGRQYGLTGRCQWKILDGKIKKITFCVLSTKNFNSILGEVAIGGHDRHVVKQGSGYDEAIGGIAVMPWEAVGLKSDISRNFIDSEVMVRDDLLKPSLGLFWKLQLASGGLETDFPSAYRRNSD
jgi:hypothetical protein